MKLVTSLLALVTVAAALPTPYEPYVDWPGWDEDIDGWNRLSPYERERIGWDTWERAIDRVNRADQYHQAPSHLQKRQYGWPDWGWDNDIDGWNRLSPYERERIGWDTWERAIDRVNRAEQYSH